MGIRGRKSADELSVLRVDGKPNPLKPPAHLSKDERRRLEQLVGSVDPTHFRPSDLPLICRYVEADALAEQAAAELRTAGPVVDGRASPWLIVQEKAVRALVSLSMRLRLSPQSRIDAKTVGRHQPLTSRPWEDTRGRRLNDHGYIE